MFSNESNSKIYEKDINYPSSEDEEEDDAKYLTQLIQKTYHSAIIELYKEVFSNPNSNVVLKKVIDLRARDMLEHIGATLPDELINDTVFTTPRSEGLSESNTNTQRSQKGETDNAFLKEINSNMPGIKPQSEQYIVKGTQKIPSNSINTDFSIDSSKFNNYQLITEKRRVPQQYAPTDKENLKYF